MILEKLLVIRGDFVRNDLDWEIWGFLKLIEVLKLWMC